MSSASENNLYWVDETSQTIYIGGAIDPLLLCNLTRDVTNLVVNKKALALTILISSDGGNLSIGFAIYNFLTSLTDVIITTKCLGVVASAAIAIFLTGYKRSLYQDSCLLIHPGSWSGGDYPYNSSSLQAQAIKNTEMEERARYLIIEHSNLTKKALDDMLIQKVDWYIGPNEALEYGLATEII